MKDKYTIQDLLQFKSDIEFAMGMMKQLEAQHPNAKVTYELATKRVSISYPLPKDHDPKKTLRFLEDVTFAKKPYGNTGLDHVTDH